MAVQGDPPIFTRYHLIRSKDLNPDQLLKCGCLVKIETDAGVTGYGETGVDAKMARARIPQLRLVGGDALAIERHFLSMTGAIHPFVPSIPLISGIDIALWDIAGKVLGLPIYRLMGGPQRNAVPMYSHGDFLKDMSSPASCREWAQMIREQPEGFTAYKIEPTQAIPSETAGPVVTTAQLKKIAQGFANVREAVGDDIDIAVHSHNQWDTPSAIAVSRATEAIHPLFFEDPLSSVEFCEGWMAIKRATRTPILTGEKLELVKQFKPFVDSQAVDIIHPDISYAGGITGCRKIADYAATEPHAGGPAQHRIAGADLRLGSPGRRDSEFLPFRMPVWAGLGASARRWPPTSRR